MASLNLLVVGECGDGKSTLIKKLTRGTEKPITGMDGDGVTKDIKKYDAGEIGGRQVTLLDSPGTGDKHITPGKLVIMLETFLKGDTVHGVLMCSNIAKNRVTLGAKVAALLAEKGFTGESKWDGFVLVGTQADRCKKKEIENFKSDTLMKLNAGCGGAINKVAAIQIDEDDPSADDIAELERLIAALPGDKIEYVAPAATVLSTAIGELMDIPPQVIEKEIIKYRESHFWKELGKGLASGLTLGMMGWDGDEPTFGFWNSR